MPSLSSVARIAGAGALAAAALCALAGPAAADPPSGVTPAASDIVGVGSDTTQFFMDQIALAYDSHSPARPLYSWDATPAGTITTKSGATAITRPDGSGAGITALVNNSSATVDFARSSRGRSASDPASIAFVAFGKDAVTVAVRGTTNAPSNLTTAQLKSIYTCSARTWKAVTGSGHTSTIKPFLPQSGSGTRSFFLTSIGITDSQIGSCVTQGVQENEGTDSRLNSADAIVPYSVAKYIAQVYHSGSGQNDFGTDDHGTLKLLNVNSTSPTTGTAPNVTINPSFTSSNVRTVYNVVRRDSSTTTGIPAYLDPIVGTSGYLCKNGPKIVKNYGFLPLSGSQCGAVS